MSLTEFTRDSATYPFSVTESESGASTSNAKYSTESSAVTTVNSVGSSNSTDIALSTPGTPIRLDSTTATASVSASVIETPKQKGGRKKKKLTHKEKMELFHTY